MADGDFVLIEIFDAQGIAESAGEFLEFEDLADVGLFVDAVKSLDAAADQVMSDGAICREHELFNEAVGDVAFTAADVGHALLFVEFDDGFGQIEVDRAIVFAARVEEKSEATHGAEVVMEVRVAFRHFGIAGEDLVDVRVGHAFGGTDDARDHDGGEHVSGGVEIHDGAHDEAFFAGIEGAHAIRERFREHGDGAVDEIDGVAAETGFAIDGRFRVHIMGDVGDVNLEEPSAVFAAFDVDRIVEIAGGFAVNGHDRKFAEVVAAGAVGLRDGTSGLLRVVDHFRREIVRQMVLANDDLGVDAEIAGAAENFRDPPGGGRSAAAVASQLRVDDGSVELGDVREALATGGWLFRAGKLLAQSGRKFVAGGEFDFVLNARVVRGDNASAGRVAEDRRPRDEHAQ